MTFCLNDNLNLLHVVLILSVDPRFGETDLPIDDIAAVFLLVNFLFCDLLIFSWGKKKKNIIPHVHS